MKRVGQWVIGASTALVAAVVVIVAMAWLSGVFRSGKIPPGTVEAPVTKPVGQTIAVKLAERARTADLVGSVQAENRTAIAARLVANIVQMKASAGDRVKAGDVLVVLDDRDLKTRVAQAKEMLKSAEAKRDLAKIEMDRQEKMVAQNVATQYELEKWRAEFITSTADVARGQQAIQEAEVALSDTLLKSPIDGIVIDRQAEPGDQAAPGRTLLTVYDPSRLRLEASVREAYIGTISPLLNKPIAVFIDSISAERQGVVQEIVPAADPASRSFLVKVHLTDPKGLYPGMFGRLRLPVGQEQRIEIPLAAVEQVGQLNLVQVQTPEGVQRRSVRLGESDGQRVEVLAGLAEGEMVVMKN